MLQIKILGDDSSDAEITLALEIIAKALNVNGISANVVAKAKPTNLRDVGHRQERGILNRVKELKVMDAKRRRKLIKKMNPRMKQRMAKDSETSTLTAAIEKIISEIGEKREPDPMDKLEKLANDLGLHEEATHYGGYVPARVDIFKGLSDDFDHLAATKLAALGLTAADIETVPADETLLGNNNKMILWHKDILKTSRGKSFSDISLQDFNISKTTICKMATIEYHFRGLIKVLKSRYFNLQQSKLL